MTTRHLIPLLLLAALLALVAAGCGGGSDTAAEGGNADDAALKWAACMRKNGADIPDPKTDENGRLVIEGGDATTEGNRQQSPAYAKAMDACKDLFEKIRQPGAADMSQEARERFLAGALRYARCMRKQGIAMPDPELTPNSAAVALPEGVDPNSPAYKKAAAACESLMPNETN